MTSSTDDPNSLWNAIEATREEPTHDPGTKAHFAKVQQRMLEPDERVLAAMAGNGWTLTDPLVVATDRRVLFLTRGLFTSWRKKAEFPLSTVKEAVVKPSLLFGNVTVLTTDGHSYRIRYNSEREANKFAGDIAQIVSGGR